MAANPPQEGQLQDLLTDDVYQAVWRYCYRLAGSQHDAEDLLQESLLIAFVKLPQLRDHLAFKSWLFSIVRSKFWKARNKRDQAAELNTETLHTHRDSSDLETELQAALTKLPQPQQELLGLFYLDGLNLEETGRVLGIPARAVKQRLFRARAALRRDLEPQLLAGDLSALF